MFEIGSSDFQKLWESNLKVTHGVSKKGLKKAT